MKRVMNPKSLENLRKEKEPHRDYKKYYSIPEDKIDQLFILLTQDKSLAEAAKEIGIKFETAKKYFEKGDPRRGIEPIHKRLIVFRHKRTEKMSEEFIKRQGALLGIVREGIDKIRDELRESTGKASYTSLVKLIKLELVLMGKPESTEEDTGILSAEEIKALSDRAEKDNGQNKTGESSGD